MQEQVLLHVSDELLQCDEQCGNQLDHLGHQSSHILDQTLKELPEEAPHYTGEEKQYHIGLAQGKIKKHKRLEVYKQIRTITVTTIGKSMNNQSQGFGSESQNYHLKWFRLIIASSCRVGCR